MPIIFDSTNVHPCPEQPESSYRTIPITFIQRGHKRQTVFTSDDDYCHYLDNLSEWKDFYKCTVSDKERELSKQAVQREQLTGGAAFIDEIEAKLQRRIEFRKRG